MLTKLVLALASGVFTAGVLAVGYQVQTGKQIWAEVALMLAPEPSPWGFELSFESPPGRLTRCGTCDYFSTHTSWSAGPRDSFDRRDPRELARSSLAWLERTIESEKWHDREWAQLELTYPSGQRTVRVAHANGTNLSWDEQLAAWFARLPPTAHGGWPAEGERAELGWTLTFETGSVQGWGESGLEKLHAVHALTRSLERSPEFGAVALELDYPSGPLDIELHHPVDPPTSAQNWPQPFAAWLDRFPPTPGRDLQDGSDGSGYSWTLTYAEMGKIEGRAPSASGAVEAMRRLSASLDALPGLGMVTYELGMMVRVPDPDAVVTNCYSVETTEASELDDLPQKLAEQAR